LGTPPPGLQLSTCKLIWGLTSSPPPFRPSGVDFKNKLASHQHERAGGRARGHITVVIVIIVVGFPRGSRHEKKYSKMKQL